MTKFEFVDVETGEVVDIDAISAKREKLYVMAYEGITAEEVADFFHQYPHFALTNVDLPVDFDEEDGTVIRGVEVDPKNWTG